MILATVLTVCVSCQIGEHGLQDYRLTIEHGFHSFYISVVNGFGRFSESLFQMIDVDKVALNGVMVEAAGFEPASRSPLQTVLHI